MSDYNKQKLDDLRPEDFQLLHDRDDKIYDKKFETQPIGYFKDAMLRFGKNKTNVIATTILFIIILCSVVIPIISDKNTEEIDINYNNLPPRMPLLELIGIANGTTEMKDQPIKIDTIGFMDDDPDTDVDESTLGLPYLRRDAGTVVLEEYIVEGSLVNYEIGCTDAHELCVGGENVLRVRNTYDHVSVISPVGSLAVNNDPYVTVVMDSISGEAASFEVYARLVWNEQIEDDPLTEDVDETETIVHEEEYVLLGSHTTAGEYSYDPTDVLPVDYASSSFLVQIKLQYNTSDVDGQAIISSLEVGDTTTEESFITYDGYWLSEFIYDKDDVTNNGFFARQNGHITMASYTYRSYDATFSDRVENAYAQSKYLEAIETFADLCEITNPAEVGAYDVGAIYTEECPIKEVIGTTSVVIDPYGVAQFSYIIELNHSQLEGYTTMPYFLFGTDSAGRDLFTLLWVATRTSLLLGFVVAGINISVGIVYGSISGYYGGWTDLIMQRIAEVIGRIPLLVTLSIMIALFGPGIQTLILILIVNGWIGVSAVTRTQFYRYKGREYVLASRTLGAKDGRLIFRHILPNGIGTIITQSILSIPGVIFLESTLSYLGFGIGHGQNFNVFGIKFSGVSVGVLLADGRPELLNRPYLTLFPAILISILMITFNMFGNALRDAFNPALRGSE